MVDVTEAMESQYLTADLVKESPTKKIAFVEEGGYEEVTFNNETSSRLTLSVEIDGKRKLYRPNRDSVSNISASFGKDSKEWVGKAASLQIVRIQGKDSIIATPF